MTADIEERVEDLERRVGELEDMLEGGTIMPSKSDLEEFLDLTSPNTHVERATAIGFWLVHEADEGPFMVADVEDAYEDCRLRKPANMSDVLAGANDRGWLMRQGRKGQNQLWMITKEGDEAVNGGFAE
ncbi:MAG: hypothetical protein U5K70_03915 [Halodesulfurarchaeum sp.]|nr:hypothetical protein [Halodesulfurarchaeum sp.]